ncbi:MAG: hypothetical protein ACRDJK_13095, partial [Actinomycetota bacterium]
MLILTLVLVALSASAAALFLAELAPGRQAALAKRLAQLEDAGDSQQVLRRQRRQAQAERLTGIIEALGERAEVGRKDVGALRLNLIQAGYPEARAVAFYLGCRLVFPVTLAGAAVLLAPHAGWSSP